MSTRSDACSPPPLSAASDGDGSYRRVLWLVLAINVVMFAIEGGAGLIAGSLSLQADALDFLGDAGTYGITLFVLSKSVRWRASAALLKGGAMSLFGLAVLGGALYRVFVLGLPAAGIMGSVGVLALVANTLCALMLFRYRGGDSNRLSVWLCSRNDAIANVAVIMAALGVHLTSTGWPDVAVGGLIAALALGGGVRVLRQASAELRAAAAASA